MNGAHTAKQDTDALNALIGGYCAGTLNPALHVLVETHLSISPRNRRYASVLDEIGADSLLMAEQDAPAPVSRRDQRLASIFASSEIARPTNTQPCAVLPAPLQAYLGKGLNDLRWKRVLPGLKEYSLARETGLDVSLLWIAAGRKMPTHTHDGSEVTLVLKGSFSDSTGRYSRGDIAIADSELNHQPIADAQEDCICFVVNDAPLHMTGPVGRIFDKLFGHRRSS